MVGRATDFVFHGQLWLVKQPVLSLTFIVVRSVGVSATDSVGL